MELQQCGAVGAPAHVLCMQALKLQIFVSVVARNESRTFSFMIHQISASETLQGHCLQYFEE
jgi:hypothetical protein